MNINAGKIIFVVIGTLSIATLWRVWPRGSVSEPLLPPHAGPVERLVCVMLPFVLPFVFALSLLYLALSLVQGN